MRQDSFGQLSIEYIFLLAVLLAFFAIFAGAAFGVFHAGLFAFDVHNARLFAGELESSIDFLSLLADGSKKVVVANPLKEWEILSENGVVSVAVADQKTISKKTFRFSPRVGVVAKSARVFPKQKIVVEKVGGVVLIKNG